MTFSELQAGDSFAVSADSPRNYFRKVSHVGAVLIHNGDAIIPIHMYPEELVHHVKFWLPKPTHTLDDSVDS